MVLITGATLQQSHGLTLLNSYRSYTYLVEDLLFEIPISLALDLLEKTRTRLRMKIDRFACPDQWSYKWGTTRFTVYKQLDDRQLTWYNVKQAAKVLEEEYFERVHAGRVGPYYQLGVLILDGILDEVGRVEMEWAFPGSGSSDGAEEAHGGTWNRTRASKGNASDIVTS